MEKKKDRASALLITGIIIVLLADAAGGYWFYRKSQYRPPAPEPVIADTSNGRLGIREDTEPPVLLLEKTENTLYIGNTDYDVSPVAYDKYGDVEITYEDSAVNFNKPGTYELKVIATDSSGNTAEETAFITIKERPKPKPASASSGSTSSGGGTGIPSTDVGGTAMPAYDGLSCDMAADAYARNNWGYFNGVWYEDNLGYTTDLQTGDYLIWNVGGQYPIGHVMLYVGGGTCFEGNYDGNLHARMTSCRYDYSYVSRPHQ